MRGVVSNKIHIIGSVGSGKSTMARNLSAMLKIPYYELDNIVWRRTDHGDVRNSTEDRDAIFNQIIASGQWIIEGVRVSPSFAAAERIIYLDTPILTRNYRILKRYVVQKLGIEKGNYEQSLDMLWKMYKWNYIHKMKEKPRILNILQPYHDKLLIIHDNTNLDKALGIA